MANEQSGELAGRLHELVDRLYRGSTEDAARAWGVPYRTLARVLAGGIKTAPRVEFLRNVATAIGATIDWLLTGQGDHPPMTTEMVSARPELQQIIYARVDAEYLDWNQIVDELADAGADADALHRLPVATRYATAAIQPGLGLGAMSEAYDAHADERRAWNRLLRAHINVYGAKRVARALNEEKGELLLGFNDFAEWLIQRKLPDIDLGSEFAEYMAEFRVRRQELLAELEQGGAKRSAIVTFSGRPREANAPRSTDAPGKRNPVSRNKATRPRR